MPADKTQLEKTFEECGVQLDRIADALKRKKPYIPPIQTKCYYANGTSKYFNYDDGIIDPVRVNDEIAHPNDPIRIEIGSQITSIQDSSFETYQGITIIVPDVFILNNNAFNNAESFIVNCPNNTMAEAQTAGDNSGSTWGLGLFGLSEDGSSVINCSDGSITV